MSKLAAIEARATQYPASTNDVVWLVARVRELRSVLDDVLQDMGVEDAPYYDAATAALAALDAPNLPQ